MMMRTAAKLALGFTAIALLSVAAHGAEHEVRMLNKGTDKQVMVYEPAFLRIQPGDTVRFVPTDKGHDVRSIDGMLPAAAERFQSKLSQEFLVTFPVPGLYGYKCMPHVGLGMVGLVEVGNGSADIAAARKVKLPPLAAKRMAVLLDKVSAATTVSMAP
jgi:pseudoazurin